MGELTPMCLPVMVDAIGSCLSKHTSFRHAWLSINQTHIL